MPELQYQTGFGNEFATEAVAGVLPKGQSAPQKVALGLYAELWTGTAFTAPRATNRRTWVYRINPSAKHKPFVEIPTRLIRSGPFDEVPTPPTQLRWDPLPLPDAADRFHRRPRDARRQRRPVAAERHRASHVCGERVDEGSVLLRRRRRAADRPAARVDACLHRARDAGRRPRADLRGAARPAVPRRAARHGGARARGGELRRRVPAARARPDRIERTGESARLPESRSPRSRIARAPSGRTPSSSGRLWTAEIDHSPLDVVAWHGNYAPYKYDLANFVALSTVTFDPPDPSIYTVLTAPTAIPGTANADFAVFPPRWIVSEHTFRPPSFHRNVSSEFLTLIKGAYHGKSRRFRAGRRQPSQLHDRPRTGCGVLREGARGRGQARVPGQYAGGADRDAAGGSSDEVRAGVADPPARLPRVLAGAEEELHARKRSRTRST